MPDWSDNEPFEGLLSAFLGTLERGDCPHRPWDVSIRNGPASYKMTSSVDRRSHPLTRQSPTCQEASSSTHHRTNMEAVVLDSRLSRNDTTA